MSEINFSGGRVWTSNFSRRVEVTQSTPPEYTNALFSYWDSSSSEDFQSPQNANGCCMPSMPFRAQISMARSKNIASTLLAGLRWRKYWRWCKYTAKTTTFYLYGLTFVASKNDCQRYALKQEKRKQLCDFKIDDTYLVTGSKNLEIFLGS